MKVVKKLVGVSSVCFALSSANAELVGEWKFPVGDNIDVCKASVGRDLEKFTLTGKSSNFVESSDDGVLPGDGHVLAGRNNGFKCYHGLAQGSSYTVVMDVLFPVGAYGAWSYHALFQPLQGNNDDCRHFLVSIEDGGPSFKVWYDSNKYYSSEYNKGVWYRFVIAYNGDEKKKSFYIDGVPAGDAFSDPKMAVNGEVFYFLLDNNGEDKALDISYAAIYDSELTANEIKADHSRPLAHDSDGSVIRQLYTYTWDLNESSSWSTLRDGNVLSSDDTVCINVTKNDAMLTVDEAVNVARIEFVNGSGAKLVVAEGKTLSVKGIEGIGIVEVKEGATVYVDSISGVNSILNNGTFVKTGDGTLTFPFNKEYAAKGVTVVSCGTLVASEKGSGDNCHKVHVDSGAKFDIHGSSVSFDVTLEDGACFINDGNRITDSYQQVNKITLVGDAAVKTNNRFGFVAPGRVEAFLCLDSHTLTVTSNRDPVEEFMLVNTTIVGDGTIYVESGRLCTRSKASTGKDCTIIIGNKDALFENNVHFTVSNFVNNGTISYASTWGRGTLEVTGEFSSKTASFPNLKLTGATLKARADAVVTVLDAFSAPSTIKVDTSEITADKFASAENGSIPVLTIPKGSYKEAFKSWQISGKDASVRSLRWRQNGNNMTLYVTRPGGIKIIVR